MNIDIEVTGYGARLFNGQLIANNKALIESWNIFARLIYK